MSLLLFLQVRAAKYQIWYLRGLLILLTDACVFLSTSAFECAAAHLNIRLIAISGALANV
jgi:hypothetical protein